MRGDEVFEEAEAALSGLLAAPEAPSAVTSGAAGGGVAAALGDAAINALVGPEAFARAMVAVRSGHVSHVEVDDAARTVSGRVRGHHRDDYEVTVFLASSPSGSTTVHRSRCSCPVAMDCKHAAAVLVVARHQQGPGPRVERAEWERVLGPLVAAAPPVASVEVAPLGLELGVERIPAHRGYAGRLDLRARPVRRGRGGGWVRSGISWEDLDFVARSYVPAHRELLLQFRAAAGAGARNALPRNPWLSLQTVSSAFWSLLDQVGAAGLEVVVEDPLRTLEVLASAEVSIDVRRVEQVGLLVGPRVRVGEDRVELTSVGVLGEPAHGVYTVGADQQLTVARLDRLLPRELRSMVVGARPLLVPRTDEERFLDEYVPGLRRHAPVGSRDGSVALPLDVPPRLALTVTPRDEHRVRLDWCFRYVAPGSPGPGTSYDLDDPGAGRLRDAAAERALLVDLPLPYATTPVLQEPGSSPATPAAHALLDGLDAALFVERVLPGLEAAGVLVELVGDLPGYRESVAEPAIAVSATERADTADWFDLHVEVSVEGERVPFDQLFVALSQGEEHLVLESGVWFSLQRPGLDRLRDLIEESRSLADRDSGELTINRFQVSLWEDLVDLGVVASQAARWSRAVRGLADGGPTGAPELPPTLLADLRPYQREGYAWLHTLWSNGLGGILADDMGLGKTVQTLALVAQARLEQPAAPPFLVVAPTSVVPGWVGEAARFVPSLRVVTLDSRARRRGSLAELAAGADVVVTSYALLRLDADEIAALAWSGLVLDEAQFVKNHRAKTYQAARRVDAPFALAITGTPLENSLMDLWSLLSVTAPGLFPSPQRFSQFYRRAIERDHDTDKLRQLQRRVRPFLLRRTKQAVAADLPPKQEQVVEVELAPRHMRVYQTHLQRERQKVLGLLDDLDRNRFTVLRSLTLLRRLCLDPALVDEAHADIPAAKVEMLLDDLTELVAEGHRALVFSQFTSFLGRIRERLEQAGIEHAYLDGSTTHREQVVERFRTGAAPVFLISLKAGGFGLNLTEADYCFVLDPWWNPATEAQAVDRAHRIGQTRKVMVYRMVAKDTIEEKVMALKARKAELFGSVFDADALGGAELGADDIRELLAA
ncbi:DEAD/DEAH box helicase [Microlunatus antarcticus]|uniref:Superfamily II DNA or RNA helicase n=1 Tax=Microlunatus antarcticus TaxID=53388 RepID=A0A7W5JTG8_9ACTN|nr:DEAD/DEAH box helicase [Microlunatus antarcticus]MBB3326041.1 superfamily II DNA or RNA helicase [Microlunatus antarcticus]